MNNYDNIPIGTINQILKTILGNTNDMLYKTFDFKTHNMFRITTSETYSHIIDNKERNVDYVITPKIGVSYLLVFLRMDNYQFTCIINKSDLLRYRSQNPGEMNKYKIRMHRLFYDADDQIFNGTIIDGFYDNAPTINAKMGTYYIHNMYLFRGKNVESQDLTFKLENIRQYVRAYSQKKRNQLFSNLNLEITQYQTFQNLDPETEWLNSSPIILYTPRYSNVWIGQQVDYDNIECHTIFAVDTTQSYDFDPWNFSIASKLINTSKSMENTDDENSDNIFNFTNYQLKEQYQHSTEDIVFDFYFSETALADVYILKLLKPTGAFKIVNGVRQMGYVPFEVAKLSIRKIKESQQVSNLVEKNHKIITCKYDRESHKWSFVQPSGKKHANVLAEFEIYFSVKESDNN